jgi:hypothetical protein
MKTFQLRLLLVLSLATLFLGACMPTVVLWQNYPHLWPTATRHPFIVIKCKYADVPDVPAGLDDHIGQFLTYQGQGLGNMLDYYGDVSYGAISLSATRVAGWYNAPYAVQAQQYPPPNQDDFERQYGSSARYQRILQCTNAVPPPMSIFRSTTAWLWC